MDPTEQNQTQDSLRTPRPSISVVDTTETEHSEITEEPEGQRRKSKMSVKNKLPNISEEEQADENNNSPDHQLPTIGRNFLVTHTSDNWKIRKAMKEAELQHKADTQATPPIPTKKKKKKDKEKKSPSEQKENLGILSPRKEQLPPPTFSNLSPLANRRLSADDVILSRHRLSVGGLLEKLDKKEKAILSNFDVAPQSLSALISPRDALQIPLRRQTQGPESLEVKVPDSKFPNGGRFLDAISEQINQEGDIYDVDLYDLKEEDLLYDDDEGFPDDDDDFADDEPKEDGGVNGKEDVRSLGNAFLELEEESSGFLETPSQESKPRRPSEEFDTDLSDASSEDEGGGAGGASPNRAKNRLLKTYKTACAKCRLKGNATFLRQCGKACIDLRHRMLTCKDAKPIAIALVSDKRTSTLDLSDNPLGPLGTSCIAEMLYANRTILELNLSKTGPGREGLTALSQTLPHNPVLKRLYLDSNKLQQQDGEILAQIITSCPELSELDLNDNNLGFQGCRQIARALGSGKARINHLNLQYNNIRTDSAVHIALSLAKNTYLRTLNLAWNGFGFDGCRALAVSLKANKTLKELDLTCNRLGIKALGYLIKGLTSNSTLSCIRVASNPLTTEGAKALVVAITEHKDSGLSDIDLRDIPVDEEFLELARKLREKKVIRVEHDSTIHMGTTDQAREYDGNELDRFDPVTVLFEYMKKDNLRVIDLFQFFDVRKRDKLSKSDLRNGVNMLMIPFTEHALDVIMKTVDKDKDGYISLDEMMKGNRANDRAVKLRRIKANRKRKPDKGLEDLWKLLVELIAKRKAQNEKRSQNESNSRAMQAGGGGPGRRGSMMVAKQKANK
ncbi:leucine-rich repeat-containing protein 74A [Aplysia californica]|uniref:Leucine-rich repeat-containing protein 74A n=1 Tax=Aplysia californica TaxID=6500 RepID=A0ABM1VZW6_APLCA|nr:leucine-rich repeat-containing protein 74A [Aplysia californica]